MKKIGNYVRGVFCNVCGSKLMSVYVRGKIFRSLDGFYFCSKCDKIFKIEDDKPKTIKGSISI